MSAVTPRGHFQAFLDGVRREGRYRSFADLEKTRRALQAAGLPMMSTQSHIIPVPVGDPELCREAAALLMEEFGIYVQPINYPTVPRGTERLRITPTPFHNDKLIAALAAALREVWESLGLSRERRNRGPVLSRDFAVASHGQYVH